MAPHVDSGIAQTARAELALRALCVCLALAFSSVIAPKELRNSLGHHNGVDSASSTPQAASDGIVLPSAVRLNNALLFTRNSAADEEHAFPCRYGLAPGSCA